MLDLTPPIDYSDALQAERERNITLCLAEDCPPHQQDLTAQLLPNAAILHAQVVVREAAVICGQDWFSGVLARFPEIAAVTWLCAEGATVQPDQVVCTVSGKAQSLLQAERAALNFLQLYSATATVTQRYVAACTGYPVRIMDTRKTIPLHRYAQKYAVRVGGGHNQRIGLFDGILIKENHIAAAGGVAPAWQAAMALMATMTQPNPYPSLQIEVESMSQLQTAVGLGARLILLDNFELDQIVAAVNWCREVRTNIQLEVSGGVTLEQIRRLAHTGVDRISIGRLTKDIQAIDYSMRYVTSP